MILWVRGMRTSGGTTNSAGLLITPNLVLGKMTDRRGDCRAKPHVKPSHVRPRPTCVLCGGGRSPYVCQTRQHVAEKWPTAASEECHRIPYCHLANPPPVNHDGTADAASRSAGEILHDGQIKSTFSVASGSAP